jgi:hypothetical protein
VVAETSAEALQTWRRGHPGRLATDLIVTGHSDTAEALLHADDEDTDMADHRSARHAPPSPAEPSTSSRDERDV